MSATESAAMDTDQVTGQKRSLEQTAESKQEEPPAKRARVDGEAKENGAEATEEKQEAETPKVNAATCKELVDGLTEMIVAEKCAPIMVRLAWHDAGTFCAESNTGGPRACMRHDGGEAAHGANAGLDVARNLLGPIVEKFAGRVSVADIWALAGCVAVEVTGGPKVPFRFGRKDAASSEEGTPEGRLPDATQGAAHVRRVFGRMGMDSREIVALSGAHTLGGCHKDRSGFEGEWTAAPLQFDNSFFVDLVNKKWAKEENESGHPQYKSEDGKLMLASDYALIEDEDFKKVVEVYAGDQEKFFGDFATAFQKLVELGCGSLYEPAE